MWSPGVLTAETSYDMLWVEIGTSFCFHLFTKLKMYIFWSEGSLSLRAMWPGMLFQSEVSALLSKWASSRWTPYLSEHRPCTISACLPLVVYLFPTVHLEASEYRDFMRNLGDFFFQNRDLLTPEWVTTGDCYLERTKSRSQFTQMSSQTERTSFQLSSLQTAMHATVVTWKIPFIN